jgi:HD-GYP domain-containing protein (c-di-GMP phosphodiesterase class II)
MLRIFYKGSKKEEIRYKLSGKAIFVDVEDDADILILEISSSDSFNDLPRFFKKTAYFYLTSVDPSIKQFLDSYNSTEILYSFYNRKMLLTKLNIIDAGENNLFNKKMILTGREILKYAENIPSLPSTTFELIKLTEDDKLSMRDIVEVIKIDQGLTAALIRLVNSPLYGFVNEITSIDKAATMLGLREIKKVALAVSILPFYRKNFDFYGETGLRIWMHSYNVAKICTDVAKLENGINIDAIYLAGLLHDIGKTILVNFLYKDTRNYEDEKEQTPAYRTNLNKIKFFTTGR